MFRIVCFNGTTDEIWGNSISEAVERFVKKHKLHEVDIESIVRVI